MFDNRKMRRRIRIGFSDVGDRPNEKIAGGLNDIIEYIGEKKTTVTKSRFERLTVIAHIVLILFK